MISTRVVGVTILLLATGCAAAAPDDANGSSEAAVSSTSDATASLDSALTTLRAQRTGAFAKYYSNGVRIEACWANPAGKNLTDLQKAFYCQMPLEFRICNSVVLLTSDESDVSGRYRGYLACQTKVDAVFGHSKQFIYGDAVDQTYRDLFLNGESGLPPEAEAKLLADNRPTGSRGFAVLLVETLAGLAVEAVDLASTAFDGLIKDAVAKTSTPE